AVSYGASSGATDHRMSSLVVSPTSRPATPTPFPYTTLFRSLGEHVAPLGGGRKDQLVSVVVVLDKETHAPSEKEEGAESKPGPRSEEHTSELQSRENLVCRLLLEKKKLARPRGRNVRPASCE